MNLNDFLAIGFKLMGANRHAFDEWLESISDYEKLLFNAEYQFLYCMSLNIAMPDVLWMSKPMRYVDIDERGFLVVRP